MVCFNDQQNETTSIIQKSNIGEIKVFPLFQPVEHITHNINFTVSNGQKGKKEYNGNFIKM